MGDTAQLASHFTRLRDFGAFQVDISMLPTQKVAAVKNTARQDKSAPGESAFSYLYAAGQDGPAVESSWVFEEVQSYAMPANVSQVSLAEPGAASIPLSQSGQAQVRADHRLRRARRTRLQPLAEEYTPAIGAPPRKKWLKLVVRTGMTLLMFALLSKSISWPALLALLGNVRHTLLLMGLTIGVCGTVISAYQWRSLLHGESMRFDLAYLVNLYLVGVAFSHFLPTGMGGDAVKAVYVGREGGNTEGSTSAVVMSRVTGFFGMLTIATLVLIIWHAHFSSNVTLLFIALSFAVAGMIVVAILSTTLLPRMLQGKVMSRLFQRHKLIQKVLDSMMRIGNALSASIKRPRALGMATLFGVIFWVIACLNYDSYAIALGINIPLYFYFVAIPLVSLVTFLPISINGFGVRESTFVYIFATMHVSSASALLLALVMDVQVIFFGVIGGCIYVMMGGKTKKSKQLDVA